MPTVIALGVAACGGGGDESASTESATVTSAAETSVDTSGSQGTVARRARLPGPPGPAGPAGISRAIDTWHPLVEAGVPGGNCRPLLESVRGPLGAEAALDEGGPPYVSLYKGIAEGCLGRLEAARSDLARARHVGLGPDDTSRDRTCNAQLLLAFGYATYLNEQISPVCPAPTTTAQASTTTTRASTTTTTARVSTTTARASTTR